MMTYPRQIDNGGHYKIWWPAGACDATERVLVMLGGSFNGVTSCTIEGRMRKSNPMRNVSFTAMVVVNAASQG
jgi:hypothetical protein